ncbi:MAG: DUF6516 family protein [Novosphingobium sp.]
MVDAILVYRDKAVLPDGGIVEIRIWRLPAASDERPHGLKYSLYYGRKGERIVGYDNEAGKGDHRHYREREEPYSFSTAEQLMADFLADVAKEQAT